MSAVHKLHQVIPASKPKLYIVGDRVMYIGKTWGPVVNGKCYKVVRDDLSPSIIICTGKVYVFVQPSEIKFVMRLVVNT